MNKNSVRLTWFFVFVLLLGFPFFFMGGPTYFSPRSFIALWDLGHILFFAFFTSLLFLLVGNKPVFSGRLKLLGFLFFVVLVFGLLVETTQHLTGNRQVSMGDVVRNQIGCLLAFILLCRSVSSYRWLWLLRFFVFAGLVWACTPLFMALYDESLGRRNFPVLSDFETKSEISRWKRPEQFKLQQEIVRHGHYSARVQLSTAPYSGIRLFYFPGDWRGYDFLKFSVYNPDNSNLFLHVRLNDKEHRLAKARFSDRFHKEIVVTPGWNDFSISLAEVKNAPEKREMNMAEIDGFGLFVVKQSVDKFIYIDYLRLE